MKKFYLTTIFSVGLVMTGTVNAYGLFIHPATVDGGCLSVNKEGNVTLELKDTCTAPETNARWELKPQSDSRFIIHYAATEGEHGNCLTFANENKVVVQECNPSNSRQSWKLSDKGDNMTISNGEYCLSAFVHPKGVTVDFQKCIGADDDTVWQWKAIK